MGETRLGDLEPMLDTDQLCELLNVRNRQTVIAWCERHGVVVYRVGGRARVKPSDVRAALDAEAEAARAAAA